MRCLLVGGPHDGATWEPLRREPLRDCWWIREDPWHIGKFGLLRSPDPNGGECYILSATDEQEAVYQHESLNTGVTFPLLEGAA